MEIGDCALKLAHNVHHPACGGNTLPALSFVHAGQHAAIKLLHGTLLPAVATCTRWHHQLHGDLNSSGACWVLPMLQLHCVQCVCHMYFMNTYAGTAVPPQRQPTVTCCHTAACSTPDHAHVRPHLNCWLLVAASNACRFSLPFLDILGLLL
jgi:hypothetical protein